ncbi:MAG: hypothetical protein QM778_34845 [Myxococcales bacterium]
MLGSAGSERSVERMREVLERDRALAFAGHAATAAASLATSPGRPDAATAADAATEATNEPTAPEATKAVSCQEPIRTRTFARLLAAQGHLERALSIYAYLIEQQPSDAGLMDEAAALRALHPEVLQPS